MPGVLTVAGERFVEQVFAAGVEQVSRAGQVRPYAGRTPPGELPTCWFKRLGRRCRSSGRFTVDGVDGAWCAQHAEGIMLAMHGHEPDYTPPPIRAGMLVRRGYGGPAARVLTADVRARTVFVKFVASGNTAWLPWSAVVPEEGE